MKIHTYLVIGLNLALLTACAQIPDKLPETKVEYRTVNIPTPVPCFTEAERPKPPEPTPIDLEHATVDQMAAAMAADDENQRLYLAALEALIIRCQKLQKEPQ